MRKYNSFEKEIWVTQSFYNSLTWWEKIKFWIMVGVSGAIVYKAEELKKSL